MLKAVSYLLQMDFTGDYVYDSPFKLCFCHI